MDIGVMFEDLFQMLESLFYTILSVALQIFGINFRLRW